MKPRGGISKEEENRKKMYKLLLTHFKMWELELRCRVPGSNSHTFHTHIISYLLMLVLFLT